MFIACKSSVLLAALLLLSPRTIAAVRPAAPAEDPSFLDLGPSESVSLDAEFFEEAYGAPLFGNMAETRFSAVATALATQSDSIYSRILAAFGNKGSKSVVVGAGGAGKTETIMRAMEDGHMSKSSFDLRGWYLEKSGMDKKDYNKGYTAEGFSAVKADELEKVIAHESEIMADIKAKGQDPSSVVFFDEMDLSANGVLNGEELKTMKLLLEWGDKAAPSSAKVLVLHPLASKQYEVQQLLIKLGYAVPGTNNWIEFGEAYPVKVENLIVEALLKECTGFENEANRGAARMGVTRYIGGHPGAYMPFLTDKDGALSSLTGQSLSECVNTIKSTAKGKVGGKLVKINVGFSSTRASRDIIKGLLDTPSEVPRPSPARDGAVLSMAVMKRGTRYYIPPVEREALTDFCDGASDKDKLIVAPVCD